MTAIRTHTLALALSLAAASAAHAQIEYDAIVIEAFQTSYAARTSIINDISDSGHTVGWATDLSQVFSTSAFRWTLAGDKARLPDSQIDRAVNNLGDAAGAMLVHIAATNSLRTIPAVDATHGRMRTTGLNDSLIAVGYAEVSAGSNSDGLSQVPFWWDPTTGTHAVPVAEAKDLVRINNAGMAVGNIRRIPGGMREAFTYNTQTGESTNLGAILPVDAASRPFSIAADIAESGLVAGNLLIFNGAVNAYTIFTWSPTGGFTVQPVLTGANPYAVALGVNSAGRVVGYTRPPANDVSPNSAIIWDAQRGVRDLNTITDLPAGFVLRRALKINESGWIAAQGYFTAQPNYTRAVVLRPRVQPCPADFNADGTLATQDIFDFLNAWFANSSTADFNGSGLSVQDIFDYLSAWFAGC